MFCTFTFHFIFLRNKKSYYSPFIHQFYSFSHLNLPHKFSFWMFYFNISPKTNKLASHPTLGEVEYSYEIVDYNFLLRASNRACLIKHTLFTFIGGRSGVSPFNIISKLNDDFLEKMNSLQIIVHIDYFEAPKLAHFHID